jgi:hypothetical protein
MTAQRFTLLEFVKGKMPDSWARCLSQVDVAVIKPWQKTVLIGEVAYQLLSPTARDANAKAQTEYRAIVEKLKDLLPSYEVVADDANHNSVLLERRHWADATFEIDVSAIRHGDQRWTNVEIREVARFAQAQNAGSVAALPSGPSPTGSQQARSIDDGRHVAKFLQERATNPDLSVRTFVLRHDAEIKGGSLIAKIRRLQRRLRSLV